MKGVARVDVCVVLNAASHQLELNSALEPNSSRDFTGRDFELLLYKT
jgi:hypothetical protein